MCLLMEFGNKCGHDKMLPRGFLRPATHKGRPFLLEEAIAALDHFYYHPLAYLKNLLTFMPSPTANDSLRARFKRSERREAIKVVAEAILYYLDIETLTLGFKTLSGWWAPTLEKLADIAGIPVQRAKRALHDLAKAGYLKITRHRLRQGQGVYRAKPSIRQIMPSFFADLGIALKRLKKTQERRRKADIEQFNQTIREKVKSGQSPFKELLNLIPTQKTSKQPFIASRPVTLPLSPPDSSTFLESKALIEKAFKLYEQDDSQSIAHYFKALKKACDTS